LLRLVRPIVPQDREVGGGIAAFSAGTLAVSGSCGNLLAFAHPFRVQCPGRSGEELLDVFPCWLEERRLVRHCRRPTATTVSVAGCVSARTDSATPDSDPAMPLPFDATLKDLGREYPADVLVSFDRPPAGPLSLLNVDL